MTHQTDDDIFDFPAPSTPLILPRVRPHYYQLSPAASSEEEAEYIGVLLSRKVSELTAEAPGYYRGGHDAALTGTLAAFLRREGPTLIVICSKRCDEDGDFQDASLQTQYTPGSFPALQRLLSSLECRARLVSILAAQRNGRSFAERLRGEASRTPVPFRVVKIEGLDLKEIVQTPGGSLAEEYSYPELEQWLDAASF